jgi:hypothetical protein
VRYDIAEYEKLWQSDPQRYGCVPLAQTIDSLQIGAQDVAMLIDKGALECFEIGNASGIRSMVTLRSLLIFKSARASVTQNRSIRILNILTEAARYKKTLLYGDVMQTMGLTYQDAMHREIFKKDLREGINFFGHSRPTMQRNYFCESLLLFTAANSHEMCNFMRIGRISG